MAEWRIGAGRQRQYRCRCECGLIAWRYSSSLRSGGTRSCGCARSSSPLILGRKECSRCGKWQLEGDFHKWRGQRRSPMCRICHGDYKKTKIAVAARNASRKTVEFRVKRGIYRRAFARTVAGKVAAVRGSARRRARRRGLPDTFTSNEASQILSAFGSRCVYFGLRVSIGRDLHWDHLIPLSRTDMHNPGTVATNMAPSCRRCNQRKTRHTHCEILGPDAALAVESRINMALA